MAKSASFGKYMEAYVGKDGRIYVCKKHWMPSRPMKSISDSKREFTHVITLPDRQVGKEVRFTKNRMFCLTEEGRIYMWRIEEKVPSREELSFGSDKNKTLQEMQFTGDIENESPVHL